jgi:8-oxo-dGTP pyrophosphatase MutT (NUDIX family)
MHLSGVIIPNDSGEILLLHRATPRRTQWEIPGGKIEEGEDASAAAAREALEELGTEVVIIRELGSESFDEDGHTILYTWFLGSSKTSQPTIGEPDKYDNLRYWSPEVLAQTTEAISPNTANFIRRLATGSVSL